MEGRGGYRNSFWAWYSFRMSFWRVPPSAALGVPPASAAAMNMAKIGAAGELIVMEVVTAPRSMPRNRSSMSASESTATPQRPTSPRHSGSSESRPMRVGRSNATDSPSPPWDRMSRNRSLVSTGVPNPANMRMVQTLVRYMEA